MDLSPSADKTHAESPREDQQTGNNAAFTPKMAPALIAEEIFRKQLHQRCEREETGGNGVHDSNDDEADFRVGAVEHVCCETNCLTDWGSTYTSLLACF